MSFSCGLPALGEMEQIICSLERGTLIQKFYARRKPEKKTLMLHRETRQVFLNEFGQIKILCLIRFVTKFKVTWSSPGQNNRVNFEGAFELREVKEVRIGKGSKDFEKWSDEVKKIELRKCFVVLYGNEFKLRSLSVVGI